MFESRRRFLFLILTLLSLALPAGLFASPPPPVGTLETLAGVRGEDRKNLYLANAAFPFFTTTFRPSLMRYRLGVTGASRGH